MRRLQLFCVLICAFLFAVTLSAQTHTGGGGASGGSFTAAGDLSGSSSNQNVIGVHFGATGLTFGTVPADGQCMGRSGLTLTGIPCGSGSGFANWSQDSTTGTITGQPANSQDAPALILQPSVTSGGTADVLQAFGYPGGVKTKCLWLTWQGSLGFCGNSLPLGSANQATASYLGIFGGTGAAGYSWYSSPALPSPSQPAPDHTAGSSSLAAGTYKFEYAYLAGNTEQYITAASTAGQVTIAAGDTITLHPPAQLSGATGWRAWEWDATQGAWSRLASYTSFSDQTISTLSGRITENPSTTNNTGSQFNTYIFAAAGANGEACILGTVPGYDCTLGSYILTQSSLTAGTNITLTQNADGTETIASTGGSSNAVVTNPSATQTITNAGSGELDVKSSGGSTVAQIGVGGTTVTSFTSLKSSSSIVVDNNGTGSFLELAADKDQIWSGFGTEDTDLRGNISVSAATSGSATFPAAYAHAPACVIAPTSNPGSLSWWVTTTTTAVTANLSASGTVTFNYICIGAND